MMGILEDVIIAFDFLRVQDEGHCRVAHDQLVVFEDVSNQTDQLTALPLEVGVEFFVDIEELQQLREFKLVTEQVEPGEPGQLAIVEVNDLAGKLSFNLLQDELGIHELIRQQLNFSFVVAIGHVLIQLAVYDQLLRQEDALQLVHEDPPGRLVDLQ
jgi:hypothetical protein